MPRRLHHHQNGSLRQYVLKCKYIQSRTWWVVGFLFTHDLSDLDSPYLVVKSCVTLHLNPWSFLMVCFYTNSMHWSKVLLDRTWKRNFNICAFNDTHDIYWNWRLIGLWRSRTEWRLLPSVSCSFQGLRDDLLTRFYRRFFTNLQLTHYPCHSSQHITAHWRTILHITLISEICTCLQSWTRKREMYSSSSPCSCTIQFADPGLYTARLYVQARRRRCGIFIRHTCG